MNKVLKRKLWTLFGLLLFVLLALVCGASAYSVNITKAYPGMSYRIPNGDITFSANVTSVAPNGLVSYWGFDGDNSLDEECYYNGTNSSVVFNSTGGPYGSGCYEFDGVASNISVGDMAPFDVGTSNFTIAGWFRLNYLDIIQTIFAKGDGGAVDAMDLKFHTTNNSVRFRFGGVALYTNISTNNGTWTFFTVVRQGDEITVYLNGTPADSSSGILAKSISNANALRFGIDSNNGALLNGSVDEISFWNRSLNRTEISSLYSSSVNHSNIFQTVPGKVHCNFTMNKTVACSSVLYGGNSQNVTCTRNLLNGDYNWWLFCADAYGVSSNTSVNITFTVDDGFSAGSGSTPGSGSNTYMETGPEDTEWYKNFFDDQSSLIFAIACFVVLTGAVNFAETLRENRKTKYYRRKRR
jgi:hypothetical protein